jgi:hypothetical protein
MSHISSTETLKSIYFSYFHSVMKYGITFWGNICNSRNIFTLQKKIIRIITSVKPRNWCSCLFNTLETLTLSCESVFSFMNFIVNSQEHFQTNSAIHSVNTRHRHDLHIPAAKLSCFSKVHATLASELSTIYNVVPNSLKIERSNLKQN